MAYKGMEQLNLEAFPAMLLWTKHFDPFTSIAFLPRQT